MRPLDVLLNGLRGLCTAIKETPLFIWVYLSILGVVARKLTYRFGLTTKSKKIGKHVIRVTDAEETLSEDVMDVEEINATFDDVGGLEDVKKALIEHVKWPFTRPELFEGNTLRSHPKGILLYGPPGTGKTLIARALARELGCAFINVRTESLFSKWVGDTEKNAAAVFTLAAKLSPCVIFVDEIDALLGLRNSVDAAPHNNAKTIFMTHWDGVVQKKSKIVVIGATNRPLAIDEAIRRRLPLQLEVPPPDITGRRKILNILMEHDVADESNRSRLVDYVASKTFGYTGSDLTELCKAAALMPIREIGCDNELPCLECRHFDEALKRVRPSMASSV
ncbi:ATPase family associated with various cellular activities (AAA), putative [Trypanosoma equiperdum]|uniref:AAA+ ATPase domain-containing protein n=4 Tax=Trypanozoon TaxID=39700 RepID=Q57W41_TRYB2|nr:hypothetical protein, conserved [Trypanosoma brucei gambiense DAL972]XP_844770.1 hypothetical protein, conserved [Trypanosoma brucei brucei TREU927]AAX70178.1 hypothetical protein, conserved [Trypanosoma brucei]RHW72589.1 ATPase family associated with various cellular activities (AAA) [Trypanosoma brucei equiperdum]SCU64873.1 ATPase family associated with various cellular activities (AAA), putative [Trypanosoma equiperdum]AAZ11211.1 hypothetical protein, conserved [Trypanosoma brucei brucei|eukprot:XP_011773281.1 hypothetical protein, conserved [Trypanosoma brucei gambiense DAL972]